MSEPQLSVRSTKARDLAHALAKRTGQPINKLVEQALERYDLELRQQPAQTPMDALLDLWRKVDVRCRLVDTSVIMAITLGEPEAERFESLVRREAAVIGWPTLLEARMVLTGRGFPNAAAIIA